jgi:hypothetical protein
MAYKLLSVGNDAKTIKGQKKGYLTGILYLAPATVAGGRTVCPFSTAGCRRVCLYTAGRGGFNSVQQARIRKTREWQANPTAFIETLKSDVAALEKEAAARDLIPAVRLNGTSDIQWEKHGIMQSFPHIQFYDYTKWPAGKRGMLNNPDWPKNYHLTYSLSEKDNAVTQAVAWKMLGVNTTVVFAGKLLPKRFKLTETEWDVIDGDLSDLRFTDPKPNGTGIIVGLRSKGKARSDDGDGFVRLPYEDRAHTTAADYL